MREMRVKGDYIHH
jgi:translation initiation factor 5B